VVNKQQRRRMKRFTESESGFRFLIKCTFYCIWNQFHYES